LRFLLTDEVRAEAVAFRKRLNWPHREAEEAREEVAAETAKRRVNAGPVVDWRAEARAD
jgi:hypothetical protein